MQRIVSEHFTESLASAPLLPIHLHRLATIDWIVIALYGIGMLAVGWYCSRRIETTEQYLLGGRNMQPWAVGMSLFATLLSTISYLAQPGEIIRNGPMILAAIAGYPVVFLIVGWLLIPRIMRERVTSAYEILEIRLGLSIRMLGAALFLALRLAWMSVIIYVTTMKVLLPLTGIDEQWAPLVLAAIGVLTIVYTSMGGLRAVVWTDVAQTIVLFGGAVLVLTTISWSMGGVGSWWPRQWVSNWEPPQFGFQTSARVTFAWAATASVIWYVCTAGADQMSVQRYLSTRDVRGARRAVLVTLITDVLVMCFLSAIGLALLAYFTVHREMLLPTQSISDHADELFPRFIVFGLPAGITGLVIAGFFAAAMSSLSSGINSCCAVVTVDFINRLRPKERAHTNHVRKARIVSILVGMIVVLLSMGVGMVSGNLLEIAYKVVNLLTVPLFILFFMALFIPWATSLGTWIGEISSISVAVAIAYWDLFTGQPSPSFLFIMPGALVAGVSTGMLASLLPIGLTSRQRFRNEITRRERGPKASNPS